MKRFIFLAFAAFIAITVPNSAFAQKAGQAEPGKRCGTTERVETMFRFNPSLRNLAGQRLPSTNNNYRLQAIVNIPVGVHIVLPNPWIVTDADVQAQIDRLNLDFSGLNPDTTNAGSFVSLRGHSQIQFCLAKRTPGGQLTNGIERRASAAGSNINLATDPIKHLAQGGLDIWDANSYLNIWVGVDVSGQGILGYAQFPGTNPINEDGVFLGSEAFGNSSCYTISVYNKGRTGTHEVGHYLGLFHIWGDENGCTGDDFENLNTAGSSVNLPANLANAPGQGNTPSDIGDTPNQAGSTTNCPGAVTTDGCATVAPGKMYQDYMDYTHDACYSMFTKKQVERMEWIVDNARAGLKTSLGCQPPASPVLLDAAPLHSVNPGGFELAGCTVVNYPSTICAGALSPKFRVVNNGQTTLTSVTVGYRFDNGAAVSQTATVNIPTGGTAVVTFSAFTPVIGAHTFKFFTSAPNSGVDQVPANDTLLQNLTVSIPVSLPQIADFELATFPPTGWSLFNPNGDFTWQRKVPGRNASAGAMWIDNYVGNAPNNIDDFRSSNISVTGVNSVMINFDLAHKYYNQVGSHDTLSVLVSNDCGSTWQTVYKKWGATLATAGSSNSAYTSPAAGDWRTEVVVLTGSTLTPGQIMVAFRNTNRFGNNIFIDNIHITPLLPPTVTSFTPVNGRPGSTVNITGTNFSTNPDSNFVFFGAVRAPVTSASFTSLTVTSPAGATFQSLSVLNKLSKLSGNASKPFITTFDNPLINGITNDFYQLKTELGTGASPRHVVMCDLDGDGKSELISADFNVDSLSVFRNVSSGGIISASSFAARFRLFAPNDPANLTTADLDGDGKREIIVINENAGLVSIYRNISTAGSLSTASFAAVVTFACGNLPGDISIGDLDKDGKPDLAVTNPSDNSIAVLRNNSTTGSISFLARQNFTVGSNPNSLAIADLDGDGKQDIVATNGSANVLSILRNQSSPGTINAGSFAAKFDFTAGNNAGPVEVADLDDDGKPEIIILNNAAGTLSVFRNVSTSAVINTSSFDPKFDFTTGNNPISLAVTDMDGDGLADIAYSNSGSNSFSILRRNSSPAPVSLSSFDSPTNFATPNVSGGLALGDLDGDGIPEVNITGSSTNVISIYQLRPVYTFKGTGNWSVNTNWANSKMPPLTLPSGHEVIINPATGNCTMNVAQIFGPGSKLTVMPGKSLMVP